MNVYQKGLYYLRITMFNITLVLIFLTLKNYLRIGFLGYLFLLIEFVYIIIVLMTILSKKKLFKTDLAYNIMHLGTYLYQIILTSRMFSFKVSTLVKESFQFYRNNAVILNILLAILIFYSFVLYKDLCQKKKV